MVLNYSLGDWESSTLRNCDALGGKHLFLKLLCFLKCQIYGWGLWQSNINEIDIKGFRSKSAYEFHFCLM